MAQRGFLKLYCKQDQRRFLDGEDASQSCATVRGLAGYWQCGCRKITLAQGWTDPFGDPQQRRGKVSTRRENSCGIASWY